MDTRKAKELILYISAKMDGEANYGATSLNKILYFADNLHNVHYGHPIAGFEYVRQEFGPTPTPKEFMAVVDALDFVGDIERVECKVMGGYYVQKRIRAARAADLSVFAETELMVTDSVIEVAKGHTAKSLSDLTHELLGWKITKNMEVIPYCLFFLRPKQTPPSQKAIDWAKKEIEIYKARHNG